MAVYPIILYDSVFNYGTPTATDTATDYSVLNIKDYRSYTYWRAASYGTKYLTVNTLVGTNLTFDSDTTGWTASNCTLASVAGGQSNNCLEITRTGGAYQYAYQILTGLTVGQTYYISFYVKQGSVAGEAYQVQVQSIGHVSLYLQTGTATAAWVQVTGSFIARSGSAYIRLLKNSANNGTLLFDELVVYPYIAVTTLGIAYHNLGQYNYGSRDSIATYANVSVESSDDNSAWTERLAAFHPTSSLPFIKTFDAVYAPYWRIKIVTSATVAIPELAVCLLGARITFPSIPRSPHNIWSKGREVITQQSKTGYILGSTLRYKPLTLSFTFPPAESNYTWWTDTFKTFWNSHAVYLKPFFFALDITNFSTDVFWVTMDSGQEYALNMALSGRVEDITLNMKGLYER